MHCFEIHNGKVLTGIPAERYRVLDDSIVSGGRVVSAGIVFEPLEGMDDGVRPFGTLVSCGEYLYGLVYLTIESQLRSGLIDPDCVLIQASMTQYACAPEYGDNSKLLTWNLNLGLYICKPRMTAIHNFINGDVFVVNNGKPELHPNPDELRLSVAKADFARRAAGLTLYQS